MSSSAITAAKKKGPIFVHYNLLVCSFLNVIVKITGLMHGPFRATTIGGCLVNGMTLSKYQYIHINDITNPVMFVTNNITVIPSTSMRARV